MEIELNRFTPAEQATFRLRALYEQAGYRKYRASRFEEDGPARGRGVQALLL